MLPPLNTPQHPLLNPSQNPTPRVANPHAPSSPYRQPTLPHLSYSPMKLLLTAALALPFILSLSPNADAYPSRKVYV